MNKKVNFSKEEYFIAVLVLEHVMLMLLLFNGLFYAILSLILFLFE